jgi:hypothetical protein
MTTDLKQSFALRVPLNRVPWFDVIVSSGKLDDWLMSPDTDTFQYALNIIEQRDILRQRGNEVAKRIRPLLENPDTPAERKQRVLRVFAFDWFHGSEPLFELFLAALKRGDFENTSQDWGMRFHQLPERYPERAVQVLEAIFDLGVRAAPEGNAIDFARFRFPEDFVGQVVNRVPESFAKAFLPRLMALMLKNQKFNEHTGLTDTVWPVLMYGMSHDLKWVLLDQLADSLSALAEKAPSKLDALTGELEQLSLRNAGYLLLSAWSGNPGHYADRVVKYLLQHNEFLSLGYASWGEGNGEAAIARGAIGGATKHCTDENLRAIETAILKFYSPFEKEEPRRFGYVQALLLHAIDPNRISLEARTRMEQLDRKFPKLNVEPPQPSAGFVTLPSPIPETAVPKMSDENWLDAMRQYNASSENDPARWVMGGVHQLASQLELASRRDKPRFARLVLKMSGDLASSYFDSLVRGLVALKDEQQNNKALEPLDSPALFAAFLHIHSLPNHPAGQWLMSAISAVADRDLPDEILGIVIYHALNGHTPEGSGGLTGKSHGANLVNTGINTIRGSAADCLASLLFRKPARWQKLQQAVASVVHDASWAVRAVGISCLTALLNINRDQAVSMFVEIAGKNDALLGSMFVPRFLHFASQTHYDALRGILQEMLTSEDGDAREAAAQAITIASFRVKNAFEDLQLVRNAPEDARAAWIEVAAENLRFSELSAHCREWLREAFYDSSNKVRDVAGRCFHRLSSDQLCHEVELIDTFLESPAFEHAATFLLMGLEHAVDRLPDVVCRIPERALELSRAQDQNQRPWWTHQMSTLVLRLYNQTRDPEIRRRCLDAIDNMIELGVGEVAVDLEKIERS